MARFQVQLPSRYPTPEFAAGDLGPALLADVTGWVLTGDEAKREANADVALLVPVPGGGLAVLTREWLERVLTEASVGRTASEAAAKP